LSYLKRDLPLYIFIIILSQLLTVYFIIQDTSRNKDIYFSQLIQSLEGEFRSIQESNNYLSRLAIEKLLKRDDILEIIHSVRIPETSDNSRNLLYNELSEEFFDLEKFNINQLNFCFPDGICILRMNDPTRFGDDLLGESFGLVQINETRKAVSGFETGQEYSRFRYFSPLFHKDEFIASAEISFDFQTIRLLMGNSIFRESRLIIKKSIINRTAQDHKFSNYVDSDISSEYLYEKKGVAFKEGFSNLTEDDLISTINRRISPVAAKKLREGKPFVAIAQFGLRSKLVVFLPVISIDGSQSAFLLSYLSGDVLETIYRDQFFTYLSITVFTMIILIIISYFRRRSFLINQRLRSNNQKLLDEIEDHNYTTGMLRKSEQRFRDVATAAGEFIWEIDHEFKYEFVTRKAHSVLGMESDELIGRSIFEFIPPNEIDRIKATFTRSLKEGISFRNLQHRVLHKNGEVNWQNDSGIPRFDQQQNIVGIRGVSMDITLIKEAESSLMKKDVLLQALSFSAQSFLTSESWTDSIIGILKMLGDALNISRVFLAERQQVNGLEECRIRNEWVDKKIKKRNRKKVDFKYSSDNRSHKQWFSKLSENTIVIINEKRANEVEKADLETLAVRSLIYIPIVPDKGWWGFIGIEDEKESRSWERVEVEILKTVIDSIAAAINKEDANAELIKLSTAVEQSSSAIAITDRNGNIEFINHQYEELSGYLITDLQGSKPNVFKQEFHDKKQFKDVMNSLNEGKYWRGKYLSENKKGEKYWEGVSISPIYDKQSRLESFILVMNDITESNRYLEELQFRADFEEIINNVSTRFINLPTGEIDKAIESALSIIGKFIGVDRSYLFSIKDRIDVMNNTHEWCAPGILAQKEEQQNIHFEKIPWWMERMNNNEVVNLHSLDELPPEAVNEREILKKRDIRSLLVLPLNYKQKLIGFIGFDSVRKNKVWGKDAVNLLKIMGEIFVNAIIRKEGEEKFNQLYQSLLNELDIASNMQNYLLLKWLNLEKEIILTQNYSPSSKVGGDLFDMIPLDESKYLIYIADISGHGVQAALIMMGVRSIINMVIENEKDNLLEPYQIINRLNQILSREIFRDENYMTILLCVVDVEQEKIDYFNAGHPSMIKYDYLTGQCEILKDKGSIPLGWSVDMEYTQDQQDQVRFERDFMFILYTDGIFECEDSTNKQLGINGLTNLISGSDFEPNCVIMPSMLKHNLIKLGYDTTLDDFTIVSFENISHSYEKGYRKIYDMASVLHVSGEIGNECSEMVMEKYKDSSLAFSVEIVINEYLNNIINHGLSSKPDTSIGMQIEFKDKITIKFWDRGEAWQLPEREFLLSQYDSKDQAEESGRGLYMIYKNSESVSLKRYDELNETIITLAIGENSA